MNKVSLDEDRRKGKEEGTRGRGRGVHGRMHEWVGTAYVGKGTRLGQSGVQGIKMVGGGNPVYRQSNVPWRVGHSEDL